MYEIRHYESQTGCDHYEEWLSALDAQVKARISARVARLADGNFGTRSSVGEGVYELTLGFGPGYRIYYALADKKTILLLTAGSKRGQQKVIDRAKNLWRDFKVRCK